MFKRILKCCVLLLLGAAVTACCMMEPPVYHQDCYKYANDTVDCYNYYN